MTIYKSEKGKKEILALYDEQMIVEFIRKAN